MANVFIERGFDVVSGGTFNHLFLVSLIKQDITGKDADAALGEALSLLTKTLYRTIRVHPLLLQACVSVRQQ